MALSYQVKVTAANKATIADMVTLSGGGTVTLRNNHASVDLLLSGDENEDTTGQKARTSTTVAPNTGFILPAGKTLTVPMSGGEAIFGLSANSTVSISVTVWRSIFVRGGVTLT